MKRPESSANNPIKQSVLFVGPYPPVIGGTAAMLIRLLPALENAGVPCRIINTMVGDRQGGALERIKRLVFFLGLAWKTLIAREKIVHCHSVNFANLAGHGFVLAACRLGGKRSVITLHAGDLMAKFTHGRSRLMSRFILALANVATTVTPELRDIVSDLGVHHSLFIANDMRYLPKGSGSDDPLPEEVLSFLDQHDPVVVLVGAMNPPYGIDVLLRATAFLRKSHPKVGALIIAFKSNNTAYQEKIASLVTEHQLHESVLFPDPFANVAEALNRSDVFVRPTLSDGDSIAVREALTIGLPVVASDVGFRPTGVMTFPVGDAQQLAARIAEAFSVPRTEPCHTEDAEENTVAEYIGAYLLALRGRSPDQNNRG